MIKHRANIRFTYEALAKWLGLHDDSEVISVSNDQSTETVSFHIRSETQEEGGIQSTCPPCGEGAMPLGRTVRNKEMIRPLFEKDLVFHIGNFYLYRVKNEN